MAILHRRILRTRFAKKSSPTYEPTSFAEYFQLGSRRNIRPIKNGLNVPDHISWLAAATFDLFLRCVWCIILL